MPKNFGFAKSERLCSKKIIEQLFSDGTVVFLYPFRVSMLKKELADNTPPQLLISVPRKNFKLATQRNHLKRRIREAYRLHKFILQDTQNQYFIQYLAFVYVAKELLNFKEIEKKLVKVLNNLVATKPENL